MQMGRGAVRIARGANQGMHQAGDPGRAVGRLLLMMVCVAGLVSACDRTPKGQSSVAPAAVVQASGERIERLDGVDISELTDVEVKLWADLVNEQLSPCGEPVTVARCAAERRGCGACVTAARYLSRLVMEGYDKATLEEHYSGRFSKQARVQIASEGAPLRGAPMAPVTIVEFSDFQCPFCAAAHKELDRLGREFEGQVKLVFKHFPLAGHDRALPAARAAEAAAQQGKFWEMHDVLFERQHSLQDEDLESYARQLNLDIDRFKADLAGATAQEHIDADRLEGERLKVRSTPTLYINGRLLREPFRSLSAYLREELEL